MAITTSRRHRPKTETNIPDPTTITATRSSRFPILIDEKFLIRFVWLRSPILLPEHCSVNDFFDASSTVSTANEFLSL